MSKIWYKGELYKMEIKTKLEEVTKEYNGLVRQIQGLDEQKQKLIARGVQLEGKLELLREQVADIEKAATPEAVEAAVVAPDVK